MSGSRGAATEAGVAGLSLDTSFGCDGKGKEEEEEERGVGEREREGRGKGEKTSRAVLRRQRYGRKSKMARSAVGLGKAAATPRGLGRIESRPDGP